MQTGSVDSFPPIFNNSSNSRLAGIAARVVEECGSDEYYDEFYFEREEHKSGSTERETGDGGEDDGEFEFAFVKRDSELPSPVSADDIFCNGQILPVYPVCNRDLFLDRRNGFEEKGKNKNGVVQTIRLPLRKLFIEERETTPSSSSSEADELEGVPEETYCVWRPAAAAEGRCKKVNSAGSNSKRWRFRDLLYRSFSDGGKDRFVISSPSFNGRRKDNEGKSKPLPPPPPAMVAPPPCKRDGRGKGAVVHAV